MLLMYSKEHCHELTEHWCVIKESCGSLTETCGFFKETLCLFRENVVYLQKNMVYLCFQEARRWLWSSVVSELLHIWHLVGICMFEREKCPLPFRDVNLIYVILYTWVLNKNKGVWGSFNRRSTANQPRSWLCQSQDAAAVSDTIYRRESSKQ